MKKKLNKKKVFTSEQKLIDEGRCNSTLIILTDKNTTSNVDDYE